MRNISKPEGKIEKYAREGKRHQGRVISKTGEELTDSKEILWAFIARTEGFTCLEEQALAWQDMGYGYVRVEIYAVLQSNGKYIATLP